VDAVMGGYHGTPLRKRPSCWSLSVFLPLSLSRTRGYAGTVAMYGQTGSGKTYTMFGDKAKGVPGLVDLCVEQLFEAIAAQSEKDYMVRVAYIEIYNESVRDLLNPTARPLKVRHSACVPARPTHQYLDPGRI